ncbi:Yip1 family protein [Thermoactinomyces sp. DSM 45892]|uniref:Yip1 family protein n=1 Tax=Thermoactinomyces sp. DSM 45892 TaxID=1882753 RepID=UPI0015A1FA86|nr:Yip1 family protein [Thermoactinomyces sp. DSM 45892]
MNQKIPAEFKLIDILFNPTNFFSNLKDKPRLFMSFLFVTFAFMLMSFILTPYMLDTFKDQLPSIDFQSGDMKNFFYIVTFLFVLFQTVISLCVGVLITHGLSILMNGTGKMSAVASVYFYSQIPMAIKALIIAIVSLVMGERFQTLFDAIFVKYKLYTTLCDPFFVWSSFLLYVGIRQAHRIPWWKSLIIVLILATGKLMFV